MKEKAINLPRINVSLPRDQTPSFPRDFLPNVFTLDNKISFTWKSHTRLIESYTTVSVRNIHTSIIFKDFSLKWDRSIIPKSGDRSER